VAAREVAFLARALRTALVLLLSARLAADMLMERLPSQIAVVLLDARAADLLAPAQSTLEEA
jgi:hypothetical protein